MAGKKVGVHGTDAETGRNKPESKKCGITKQQFIEHAKPILVVIDGKQMIAAPKSAEKLEDGSSFGYYCGDKMIVTIDGVPVSAQVGLNITIIGSKTKAD